MTVNLDPQIRELLLRFLKALYVPDERQRADAALNASWILKDLGLTWNNVLAPPTTGPARPPGDLVSPCECKLTIH